MSASRIPVPFRSMLASSTVTTRPMPGTWPICCAWASCRRATFNPVSSGRFATCCAARQKTLHHLSLQSLIVRHTGERLSANQVKALDTDAIADKLADPIRLGGQITHLARNWHEQAIKLLEDEVLKHLKPRREYQLLSSIPGVGKILASTIALETGRIERFPNPGHYASYARCVNTERVSNGKLKGRGNKRNGNKYLAWAFMEAAHYAAIWSPEIKRFYQKRQAKRHILVAKKTVANKLAKACYHILKRQEPFDVTRAFG